ncbi:hypothetical protein S4A8_16147 [Salinisphaera sp. S4-8]|uniref:lipopolysaccharide biosynthesis protein n=1 Tax=Salinisphaera sp. S4-8 TaxID=633357 RepID=UPI003342BED5
MIHRYLSLVQGPIARATLRTSVVLGVRLLVQAGTLLLIARLLGPQQFGAFAGIAALALVLGTLSTLGTHLVLLGDISKASRRRDDLLSFALPTTLLCGGLLLTLYLALCVLVLHAADISLQVILAVGVAEILLQPLIGLCVTEHHGLGRIARAQLITLVPLVMRLMVAGGLWVLSPSDTLVIYAYGYGMASVATLALVVQTLPAPWPSPTRWRPPRAVELKEAAGFAALSITKAGPGELDKTLATRLLPLTSAGLYAASARVIGATTLPVTAMALSALPRLFRDGESNSSQAITLSWWMFTCATGYGLALAAVLWMMAPAFGWLFGPAYAGMDQLVRWSCIAVPAIALRLTSGTILMALGKAWVRAAFEAGGLVILMLSSIFLVQHLGLVGMPLALACSEWTMALAGFVFIAGKRR